jgi:hypothetical protein
MLIFQCPGSDSERSCECRVTTVRHTRDHSVRAAEREVMRDGDGSAAD